MIAFGFCTNFYAAITFRFLWGMSDGYLGICKTILSEICSPDMLCGFCDCGVAAVKCRYA